MLTPRTGVEPYANCRFSMGELVSCVSVDGSELAGRYLRDSGTCSQSGHQSFLHDHAEQCVRVFVRVSERGWQMMRLHQAASVIETEHYVKVVGKSRLMPADAAESRDKGKSAMTRGVTTDWEECTATSMPGVRGVLLQVTQYGTSRQSMEKKL
jgi:hypothetical protein